MFRKVITAEDLDTNNIAIEKALGELLIPEAAYARYCDEALLKIRRALHDSDPYQLLITDLSFKADHRNEELASGQELIAAVRRIQPDIKIIVFTVEDKPHFIKSLFSDADIDGYVVKGRNSIPELKKTIQAVYDGNEQILSAEIAQIFRDRSVPEIEPGDRELLRLISTGIAQTEISRKLRETGSTAGSQSSIEKRINRLKSALKANNNAHLIAIAKDLGLI